MDQAQQLRNIVKQSNIPKQNVISNSRVIAVTSGKGGVGKSNVSINLALHFQRMGKKVIILDADFGLANIEVMFGIIPEYNLGDLIYNGKEISQIITKGLSDVGFISGGSGIAKMVNLTNEQLRNVVLKLSELEQLADIIIIDTGAGISPSVLEFVASSPEVILVTTPEPTSVTDSYALLKALTTYSGFDKADTKIRVIANRVSSSSEGDNLFEKLQAVVGRFLDLELDYVGFVPSDENITRSVMKQKPVSIQYPNSAATKAFEGIAAKLLSDDTTESKPGGINRFFLNFFLFKKNKNKDKK